MEIYSYQNPGTKIPKDNLTNPVFIDRSRHLEHLRCPMKRYWSYHAGPHKLGFDSPKKYDDLAVGTAVHLGMEVAMQTWFTSAQENEPIDIRELALMAYDVAQNSFLTSALEGLTISGDPLMAELNPEMYRELSLEQAALAATLAGAGVAVWLPQIMASYDLISTEQEINWLLPRYGVDDIVMMSRPDAILKRKSDGRIFVVSYKTSKSFQPSDLDRLRVDLQALTEMASVYSQGLDVSGCLYAYFIKGPRRQSSFGDEIQTYSRYTSGWLRPWIDPRSISPQFKTRYESLPDPLTGRKTRLNKDHVQLSFTSDSGSLASFEALGVTHRQFFEELLDGEFDEENGGNPLEFVIAAPDPILRPTIQMDRIIHQISQVENDILHRLDKVALKSNLSPLDIFTLNSSSCFDYQRACRWLGVCWEGQTIDSLFINGKIVARVPNHSQEVEDE